MLSCRSVPRFLASVAAALAVACGAGSHGASSTGDGVCSVRLAPTTPAFTDAPVVEAPESRIAVDVRVAVARLKSELSRHVPVVLAQANRRDVGTPGQATYVVRRGDFNVRLDADQLVVENPVSVELAVCKPFGPLCPTYGRCSPRLSSSVRVPLLFDGRYQLGASRVDVGVTRGCVLTPIGVDVTPELQRMAGQQAGGVKRQIDRSLPSVRPEVQAVWHLLHSPVSIGNTLCARIAPERLVQQRPTLQGGVLSSRLAAYGRIGVEDPCSTKDAVESPLPAPDVRSDVPAGVALDVPIRIDWDDVSAALTRSLAAPASDGATRIVRAQARGALVAGRPVVALALTVEGRACGDVWVVAEPWYDAQSSRVRLRRVAFAPDRQPEVDPGLPAVVERRAAIALPVDLGAAPASLENLVKSLIGDRPAGVDVRFQVKPPSVERVLVDKDALVPVASLRGSAIVEVK